MKTAADIIEDLGGATAIAKVIGAPVTTVHGWKRTGHIPEWRRPALVKLARKAEVPLGEADFPPRPERSQAA